MAGTASEYVGLGCSLNRILSFVEASPDTRRGLGSQACRVHCRIIFGKGNSLREMATKILPSASPRTIGMGWDGMG